jgi:Flp pilus assembly protein TadG
MRAGPAEPAPSVRMRSVRGPAERRGAERGSATAEVAILLPGLVLMLAFVLAAGTAVVAQIRCVDAARAGARLAARGEPDGVVRAGARDAAPARARVAVSAGRELVTVQVTAIVAMPLPGAPALQVHGTASARTEHASGPSGPSYLPAPGGFS